MNAREEIDALVKKAMAEKAGAFSDLPEKDPDAQRILEDYRSWQRYARDRAMLQKDRMSGATRTTMNRQMPTGKIRFSQPPTTQQMGRYSNGKMIPPAGQRPATPTAVAKKNAPAQNRGGFDFKGEAMKLFKERGFALKDGVNADGLDSAAIARMKSQYADVKSGKMDDRQKRAILDEWKKTLAYARPMNAQEIAQRANDPTWNTAARRAQLAKLYMPNPAGTSSYRIAKKDPSIAVWPETGTGVDRTAGSSRSGSRRRAKPAWKTISRNGLSSLGTGGMLSIDGRTKLGF